MAKKDNEKEAAATEAAEAAEAPATGAAEEAKKRELEAEARGASGVSAEQRMLEDAKKYGMGDVVEKTEPSAEPPSLQSYGIPEGYPVPAELQSNPRRASELLSGTLQAHDPFATPLEGVSKSLPSPFNTEPELTAPDRYGNARAAAPASKEQAATPLTIEALAAALRGVATVRNVGEPPTPGMDVTVPGGKSFDLNVGKWIDANGNDLNPAYITAEDRELESRLRLTMRRPLAVMLEPPVIDNEGTQQM